MSLRRMSALIASGLRCFREYLSAKGRGDKTLEHIGRLVEMLNPCVFSGISKTELERYAWTYARNIQNKLDMRLISPIKQVVFSTGIPIVVISSGCREGIMPSLWLAGLEADEVLANAFVFDGQGVTEKFDFSITHNKEELLTQLLERHRINPGDIMYIGDACADENCFYMAGYSVVSFFASPGFRARVSSMGLAYAPVSQQEFAVFLQKAVLQ